MEYFDWNLEKNTWLKKNRNISFEEAVYAITHGNLIKIEKNSSRKYPNQYIYIIKINNYCYLVPFVKTENKIFLKTVIPSRKATKKYISKL